MTNRILCEIQQKERYSLLLTKPVRDSLLEREIQRQTTLTFNNKILESKICFKGTGHAMGIGFFD